MKIEQNYQTIQALRLVAAASVALTHATFYLQTRSNPNMHIWEVGSQGVQIFFVISGFVMALSSGALSGNLVNWNTFIAKRIARIAPIYWLMNLLKLATLIVVPGALLAKPDASNILLSLIFIPSRNENGIIETFYGVGWTLNFEMFFYLIVAACLFFKTSVILYSTLALGIFLSLSFIRQDDWPAFTYILHPYLANFIWGLLIAKVTVTIDINKPFAGTILVIASSYFIFINPIQPTMSLLGIQYGTLVLGLVMIESKAKGRIPNAVLFGGDASYSLYLTHAMIGPIAAIATTKLGIHSIAGSLIFISITMLLTAAGFYVYIERRIGRSIAQRLSAHRNLQ